jgi:hypothetical protein
MTVKDCPCDGFFVWTPLLDDGRLERLTQEDRETLSQRVRHLHDGGALTVENNRRL